MMYDLTEPLVIGISSRALFDLEEENQIFETQGAEAFSAYQKDHENDVLRKGPAFHLVEAFLRLNQLQPDKRLVEVIVMSRTSPDASLRVFKSIAEYQLDITRAALVSGAEIAPYLKAFQTDLFLSAYAPDVKQAVDDGIAAGTILTKTAQSNQRVEQIRIAFDGDAVLFSAEAERIFQQEGIDAFIRHEKAHADKPLPMGPFANFLKALSHMQGMFAQSETAPIRTALVTSRSAPAHERAIKTLREWNVRVDEAFFLGGVRKKEILSAFGAHIFFDDQEVHAAPASDVVAAALVPYREGDNPKA
ncbi:MAG: 5'-nucleotidase [Clostridiales bacterium]|nr:5'-nucleotidase [Clostridiales bacterium]